MIADIRQAVDLSPVGTEHLAEMARRIDVARVYSRHVVERQLAGEPGAHGLIPEVCFAKNTAVEAGEWVANQAVQLFGGMGYMAESEVERQYRDMRILGIGGGTTGDPHQPRRQDVGIPIMTALRSTLDPSSPAFGEAADAMAAKLAELDGELLKAMAGGGPKYVEHHHARGKLTPRERIELLVDPDSPFLELCPLAGYGSSFQVGASLVAGIGVVEGVECLLVANDPTVKGGTSNPWTLKKILRCNQIAFENRLPVISLVESGGADLPTQKEIFIPGRTDVPRSDPPVGRGHPDNRPGVRKFDGRRRVHTRHVRSRRDDQGTIKVFLAGPPLVKMATGEESDDESLGVPSARPDIGFGRPFRRRRTRRHPDRPSDRGQTQLGQTGTATRTVIEPLSDPEELIGVVPPDLRIPFDPREVIARIVDGSGFDEFKAMYGSSWSPAGPPCTATLEYWPTPAACCSARNRRRPPSSSSWRTGRTRHCCSCTHNRVHGRQKPTKRAA